MKAINFLKKNWLPLFFSVVVGLVIVFPNLLLIIDLKGSYQGINFAEADSENYYVARIREIYDGHHQVSNAEFYEYKNLPPLQPALVESLLALFTKLFFITPAQAVIFGKFLFPALLFLAMYFFAYKFTESKTLALAFPLVVIFCSPLISSPFVIFDLFNGQLVRHAAFNEYSRVIHPQISSLIFFIWLSSFYLWVKTKKIFWFYLTTVLFGLMFYVYLYSWLLAVTIMGLFFLLTFSKVVENGNFFRKRIILLCSMGFVMSMLYWLNLFAAIKSPYYQLASSRYGFYHSHRPLLGSLLIFDFAALVIFYHWQKKNFNFYFLAALLSACLIVINQQIITGLRFYPGHWHWYYIIPFSIFLALWLFYFILNKFKSKIYLNIFFISIIVFSLVYGFGQQTAAFLRYKDVYADYQRYASVFNWLQNNTNKEDVVLTNKILRDKILVYTGNNNYLQSNFDLYLTPSQRFADNFFVSLKLDRISLKDFSRYILENPYDVWDVLPGYANRNHCGCDLCYNVGEISQLAINYNEFLDKDFYQELKKYRLDYAVWDTKTDKIWDLDQYPFFKFIIEINGVRIYKFI